MDAAERTRLQNNEQRIEALMTSNYGWYSSLQLMEVGGLRALARVHALKAKGYRYERRSTNRPGIYEYRLIPKAAEQLSLMEAS
jgi:hypothetical protein